MGPSVSLSPYRFTVADHVSEQRLLTLLARGAEGDDLDFKQSCDIRNVRDVVKLAKHVDAMTAFSGHIAIGVDSHGKPLNSMPAGARDDFDPVRLRAKLRKWLPEELEIHSQTWDVGGANVVLIYVSDGRDGPLEFHADGYYTGSSGSREYVFRTGESYYRSGTADKLVAPGDREFMRRLLAHHRARASDPAPSSRQQQSEQPLEALTTAELSQRVLLLLEEPASVRLRELLKSERRRFEGRIKELLDERRTFNGGNENFVSFEEEARPVIERYLAVLLPLVDHRSELITEQINGLEKLANAALISGPYNQWNDLARWVAWVVAETLGAFAVSVDNLPVVGTLLDTRVLQMQCPTNFALMFVADGMRVMLNAVARHGGAQQARETAPQFPHLVRFLNESEFIAEAYPELRGDDDRGSGRWVHDFDFLAMFSGASLPPDRKIIGAWGAVHDGAVDMARRLRDDDTYRATVGEQVFRVNSGDFDDRLREWGTLLKGRVVFPGGYCCSDASSVLSGKYP